MRRREFKVSIRVPNHTRLKDIRNEIEADLYATMGMYNPRVTVIKKKPSFWIRLFS